MRKKEAWKIKRGPFWCNVLRSARFDFCATELFPGTFFDFRFMMFTKVLLKNLARMLIYVRKIFNFKVFFKMLLPMCLSSSLRRNFEHSCDQVIFRVPFWEKITVTVAEVVFSQVFCPLLSFLEEAKVSTVNSDLTNFVNVQGLHENSKWNMWV